MCKCFSGEDRFYNNKMCKKIKCVNVPRVKTGSKTIKGVKKTLNV